VVLQVDKLAHMREGRGVSSHTCTHTVRDIRVLVGAGADQA
jgi:hypothetical protein